MTKTKDSRGTGIIRVPISIAEEIEDLRQQLEIKFGRSVTTAEAFEYWKRKIRRTQDDGIWGGLVRL